MIKLCDVSDQNLNMSSEQYKAKWRRKWTKVMPSKFRRSGTGTYSGFQASVEFLLKPRRISGCSHKAHNDYKRISGRSFQTRHRFSTDF
jgi:hypothetical protein